MNNNLIEYISLVISIFILGVSVLQTRLSNIHALFERRMKNYSLICDLISVTEKNISDFEDEKLYQNTSVLLHYLTDNVHFYDIKNEIGIDMYTEDSKLFKIKLESLNQTAKETAIIFKSKDAEIAMSFLIAYANVLEALYTQQRYINEHVEVPRIGPMDCPTSLESDNKTLNSNEKAMKDNAKAIRLYERLEELSNCYRSFVEKKVESKLLQDLKVY